MYLSLCVLGILGVSASAMLQPRIARFYYSRSQFRRSDDCNICYDGDCLPLDQSRCDYYEEADTLIQKDNEEPEGLMNIPLKNEVDGLIFNIIEKASLTASIDCIPFISRYSNCIKENICIGCKTCSCTSDGKWNCTSTNHCHVQEPAIDVDHRILVTVIENLISGKKGGRGKRSVTEAPLDAVVNTMSVDQLSEWFYGNKPLRVHHPDRYKLKDTPIIYRFKKDDSSLHIKHSTIPTATQNTVNTEPDYLAFDEVLSNIAIDSKNYTRRKPPPVIEPENANKTVGFDYMLIDDDDKLYKDNATDNAKEISYIVDYMHGDGSFTKSPVEETTKIVIDLLELKPNYEGFNETDYTEIGFNGEDLVGSAYDKNNDVVDFNTLNIMKRDVIGVSETKKAPNVTNITTIRFVNITSIENKTATTEKAPNLKEDVLLPLIKAMNDKKNELQNLEKVKENLINFMTFHNQSPIVEIIDYPNISASSSLHDIEMFPDMALDLRRTNPDIRQKFMYKLKSDIYEVVKDILALQRYRKGDLPDDLNFLIHSLKRFVSRPKPNQKKLRSKPLKNNYRRRYDSNTSKCLESTFKQCMVEVLQAIDKDMPKTNALGSLSLTTKRIMRHVLRTFYTDELTSIGLKVHDPTYNMSHDLQGVGSKWQDISDIVGSSPFITLYRMKLLHYFLEMDIIKLNEALSLVAFAHSRRMTPYFKNVQKNVMEDINSGLNSIHNKVEVIVKYYSKKKENDNDIMNAVLRTNDLRTTGRTTVEPTDVTFEHRQQKKRSFIKYIRNLLKSSKKDIHELLHRQVPKSEIVKQLAIKKLDELAQKRYTEYEEAMRKWQKNLGVMTRYRRNADELSSRIKNIIPKYLRHKVKPKIHEKKNSTHKSDKKGKKKNKHGRKMKHKKTTLTTATTPKTKATTALKTKRTTKVHTTAPAKVYNTTLMYI